MSGDISERHNEGDAPRIQQVEAGDATKHATTPKTHPHNKDSLNPKMSTVMKLEKCWSTITIHFWFAV